VGVRGDPLTPPTRRARPGLPVNLLAMGAQSRRRAMLTVSDQVVSSGSNFATGVAVARLSGITQFGQYMVVVVFWLVLVGLHRALITEPMVVTSRDADDLRARLADGLAAEAVHGCAAGLLVALGGALALAGGHSLGVPLLAMSVWLPGLLIQDYWRAMAFQQARPGAALANDVVFVVVQAAATITFAVVGWRSVGYMIAAWGLGGLAGAVYGYRRFPAISRPVQGWRMLARLWPQSRWILADFASGYLTEQANLLLAAVVLSTVEFGGFRAAYTLIGPILILLLAEMNLGLPEATRRAASDDPHALDHFARRLSAVTFVCIAAYGVLVAVAGRWLLSVVYGPGFPRFSSLVTLGALSYAVASLSTGEGIALKAGARMSLVWRARLLVGLVSLVSLVVLVHWLGVVGAGWSSVATAATWAVSMQIVYRLEQRRTAPAPVPT
jgi:O-antigen/teichoic acid export membrane protein